MTNESIPIASSKAGISASQGTDSRTRVLLHGPVVLTLLRLGPPNVVVNADDAAFCRVVLVLLLISGLSRLVLAR